MNSITEPQKAVPVIGAYDVAVCGGGPAGLIAATAAARCGARTVLIEHYGFLGGTATAGMVSPIGEFRKAGRQVVGGIPLEFAHAMEALGGARTDYPNGSVPFDPETYKLAAQRMVLGAGADLLLHTDVCGCRREDGCVTHLIVENKSGRQAVAAHCVVDATGDADVATRAGFPTEVGGENGELQPMTLWFRLGGVDTEHLENLRMDRENTRYSNSRIRRRLLELPEGRVPQFGGPWFLTTLRDGEVAVNITRCAGNGADARSLTEAECRLREDVFAFVLLLREIGPEFRRCHLLDTGVQAGVRETRRIMGLYRLTADDVLNPKDFEDTVAKGMHPIDIHRPDNSGQKVRFLEKEYAIPFRSLVPVGSRNLAVAGRCLSASREAFASARVQASCMALGQAAGTAAALCAHTGADFAQLDGADLRKRLRAAGAVV